MTIFLNNIKRILKDRVSMFFILVLPVLLIGLVIGGYTGGGVINIGLVDKDNSNLTKLLTEKLNSQNKMKVIEIEEEDIKQKLIDTKVDYVIYIDKGFTDKLIEGKDVKIKSYSINNSNLHIPAKLYIDNFINIASNISKGTNGNKEKFYEAMKYYEEGNMGIAKNSLQNNYKDNDRLLGALGVLVTGLLSLGAFGYSFIIEDKEDRIYHRIFTTPLTLKNYMIQNILSGFSLAIVQILILLGFIMYTLKIHMEGYFFNLFIILSLFSMLSVALGIFINSVSKSRRQASLMGTLIFTPVCMLGGCYWPREIMPEILQNISNFVPTTWVLKGAEKIIYGDSLSKVTLEIGILLLFTIVFFLLSSWKVSDISN